MGPAGVPDRPRAQAILRAHVHVIGVLCADGVGPHDARDGLVHLLDQPRALVAVPRSLPEGDLDPLLAQHGLHLLSDAADRRLVVGVQHDGPA
eukprot:6864346-Alexandrium_andersonii.AAC.1